MNEQNNLITRTEAMNLLRVTTSTISRYIKQGRLSYYQVGGKKLFSRDQILNESRHDKQTA